MKKKIFLVLACLVSTVQAFASGCCDTADSCNPCCAPSDCCLDFDSKIFASVGGGLRWDSIGWKTSATGFSSDSFHQKWNDIKMGVIEANVAFLACEHYLLKGNFDYGWVYGKNHLSTNTFGSDSDFSSSSNFGSHSKNGHAYDLSAGIGYQFNFECYPVSVAPLVGYSYNVLNLRRSSFDLYGTTVDVSSSSNGHNHKFRLSGPWLGFGAAYQASCDFLVYLDYAFHWANFRATLDEGLAFENADLNFSKSFKSKNAYGNEVTIGGVYTLCDCWFAGLKFNYKNWYTNKKRHHTDPYDSSFSGSGSGSGSSSGDSSRFRNLDWNTYIVTVDIGYTF